VPARFRLLVLAAATAVLTACGGGTDPAATVDGTDVTREDVAAAQAGAPTATAAPGQSQDEAAAARDRQMLGLLITDQIISALAEERGVEVDDADVAAAREEVLAGIGGEEQVQPALDRAGFSPELFEDVVVPQQARLIAIGRDVAGDRSLETRTVRHIMVASVEEAEAVREELAGGADFAALAQERSSDTASAADGGELPPVPQGALPEALDEAVWSAPLEEVQGPVESESGVHVFEVLSEQSTPAGELTAQQVGQLVGEEVQEVLQSAFADAEVEVDESYGRWDADQQTVVPIEEETTPPPAPAPSGIAPGGPGEPTEGASLSPEQQAELERMLEEQQGQQTP
jgi:foldase protein PrsA